MPTANREVVRGRCGSEAALIAVMNHHEVQPSQRQRPGRGDSTATPRASGRRNAQETSFCSSKDADSRSSAPRELPCVASHPGRKVYTIHTIVEGVAFARCTISFMRY
jgi:hypothetical protein